MEWYKFEDGYPPLNEYILVKNENSKGNNICPAVSNFAGSYLFISCAGCRWSIPSEPYTHWSLFANEALSFCDICAKKYIRHLCSPTLDQHRACKAKSTLHIAELKNTELKNHELALIEERNNNIRLWVKRFLIFITIYFVCEKIASFVVPLIKTEIEFRYKRRYIKMYKEELKEEIKETSKFAVDSIKDVIKELKK